MLDLTGKVAMVTGAGSSGPGWGNGKATATLLARQGAQVYALDINEGAARETCEIIASEGGIAVPAVCDMTDSASVEAAVRAGVERFGRIDILVNNVGGSAPGDVVTMSEEVWDGQFDLNLKTAFLGCKHVLPVMLGQAGGGVVVNIASVSAMTHHVEGRTYVAYSASKAGMVAFSRSTAMTYVRKKIRCNTLVVGSMHTPLVENRLVRQLGAADAASLIAQRNAAVPMGHMGDAWDVANAAVFLASDEARHITGTELVVDGGLLAARAH